MTLLYLFAGTMAGTIGIIARSLLRLEEEHPKSVHDHVCFVNNALLKMRQERGAISEEIRSGAAGSGASSWAELDPSLGRSAALFSQQLSILQQSLHRESVPSPVPAGSRVQQTEAELVTAAGA